MIRAATRFRSMSRLQARPVLNWETSSLTHEEDARNERDVLPIGRNMQSVLPKIEVLSPPCQHYSQQSRFYSSTSMRLKDDSSMGAEKDFTDASSTPSVQETLDKLFQEQAADKAANAGSSGDAWYAATEQAAAIAWDPHWYNLADQAIQAVRLFHDVTGAEWALSIVGVTVILRTALFPLMVSAQQTTSRMAHLQPELTQMKARYEAIGEPTRQDQLQFSNKMKALFAKYKVKPFRAFTASLVQFPLFMGMFFGLRKMPGIFPDELTTGGMLWFPDLTQTDPLYILPLASAGTFLALIEMGKDQMMAQNAAQGQLMLNVFRVLSLTMIPVCINFEASMLCYWTSNNILTLAQTAMLKTPAVRKYFGIWDPPKPVPGMEPESFKEAASKLAKRISGQAVNEEQRIKQHNQAVEVKKKARSFQMLRRERRRGITGKRGT